MDLLVYILPAVIFLLSIGYIFANFREKSGLIIIGVVSLFNIGVLVACIIFAGKLNDQIAVKEVEIAELQSWKDLHIVRLERILAKMDPENDELQRQLKGLVDYGWSMDNPAFAASFSAATEKLALIANREPPKYKISIHNLPTIVDTEKVTLSLEELGFEIDPTVDEEQTTGDRNVLYYGAKVPDDEIKLATLTLIQAGVQIRMLKSFKKKTKKNIKKIQLDWKKNYSRRSPLSVSKIMSTESFSRK